jgi:TolB protein
LVGSIVYFTDRENVKEPQIYMMNKDGALTGKLTGDSLYLVAAARDLFSPDRAFQLDVSRDPGALWKINLLDTVKFLYSPLIVEDNSARGVGAYHPSWSPSGDRIAFVSERTGYSEIYVFELRTGRTTRLTNTPRDSRRGFPPYNKHPSWSPDGGKIIFSSDRDTDPPRFQIYIMNADGTGLRNLSPDGYNDWDPIWVKNIAVR